MENNFVKYQHTQIGYLVLVILFILILYFAFILTLTGNDPLIFAIIVLVLVILSSFTSLKVTVDQEHLRIKFGYGIFIKKFALNEIASVKAVRNHWYHGWGIRVWFWPKMWIFNVSGFDAIEIQMKDGKNFRIGTDEPAKLEQAIHEAIGQ